MRRFTTFRFPIRRGLWLAAVLIATLTLGIAPASAQSRSANSRSQANADPIPTAPGVPAPPAATTASRSVSRADSPNYRLLTNDLVNIKVFQEDELQTTERLARDGTISFPFLGSVSLVGRTLQESAEMLQTRLREYLVHPQVTVRVVEYSKRRFTVLGQVSKPGIYELPDDSTLTLLEAIGMAGGYTRIANPSKITLKRQGARGEETLFRLDASRMAKDKDSPRFQVLSGDTILVGESFL